LSKSVEDLFFIDRDGEDRIPVGDEADLGEVVLHVPGSPQVIPRSAHPLDRHPVVEETLHDPKGDEVTERVEAAPTRSTAGLLERGLYQCHLVPVAQLMRRTACESSCLLSGETFHAFSPSFSGRPAGS
jgi:hypothetical protein